MNEVKELKDNKNGVILDPLQMQDKILETKKKDDNVNITGCVDLSLRKNFHGAAFLLHPPA